jgi:predicted acyl esterase
MASKVSGIDPGQRQLNGTQTSGREYRQLSTPDYGMTQDDDVTVPINEPVSYRIPIVGTGYRFAAGHRLRLVLTSDDQDPKFPAEMSFRHASVGTSSLNRIAFSSRLLLPVAAGTL